MYDYESRGVGVQQTKESSALSIDGSSVDPGLTLQSYTPVKPQIYNGRETNTI